jgi:hypothetical protein
VRRAVRYSAGDTELLDQRLAQYLRHDLGYAGTDEAAGRGWTPAPAPASESTRAVA